MATLIQIDTRNGDGVNIIPCYSNDKGEVTYDRDGRIPVERGIIYNYHLEDNMQVVIEDMDYKEKDAAERIRTDAQARTKERDVAASKGVAAAQGGTAPHTNKK